MTDPTHGILLEDEQHHDVSFTGSASEYFRIWTVNVFLTIVTLGLYGPWAKVRKRRYLYAHTWVADSNFDYHADPRVILRGRLIALTAFALYSGFGVLSPNLATTVLVLAAPLVPLLVLRALTFGAVNSSYRNLRFNFRGRYWDVVRAIGPLLLIPLLARAQAAHASVDADVTVNFPWLWFAGTVVVSLAYPYMAGWRWRVRLNGTSYGAEPFSCPMTIRDFYRIYGRAVLLVAGGAVVATGLNVVLLPALMIGASGGVAALAALVPYVLLIPLAIAFTRAEMTNAALGTTRIGPRVRFVSELSAVGLAALYVTNTLALACSCGLLTPWVVVRTARYRSSALQMVSAGDLDDLLATMVREISATGAEIADLFDFDFAL